jgi:hypothetical protein
MTPSDAGPQLAASHAARSLPRVARKRPSARFSSQENKAVRRLACSDMDFEPLLAGTVFRDPRPRGMGKKLTTKDAKRFLPVLNGAVVTQS